VISLARTTRLTESPSRRRCLASAWLGWSAAVGLLAALASATSLAADDAAEVEALERRLVDAIGSRDLETYSRLVADDYVATRPDGSELTKAQVMASYRSGEREGPCLRRHRCRHCAHAGKAHRGRQGDREPRALRQGVRAAGGAVAGGGPALDALALAESSATARTLQ
jgi:Domain of unknown function (DUF4440)